MPEEKLTPQKIWQWTKSAVKFAGDLLLSIPQGFTKGGVGIALDIANLFSKEKIHQVDPSLLGLGKVGEILFGKEPILSISERIKRGRKFGRDITERYVGTQYKQLGEILGGLGALGLFALDVTPIGGVGKTLISKGALKTLAKETSESTIKEILKKEAPDLAKNEQVLNELATKIAGVSTPKDVLKTLRSSLKTGAKIAAEIPKELQTATEGIKPPIPPKKPPKGIDFPFDAMKEFRIPKERQVLHSSIETLWRKGEITQADLQKLAERGILTYTPKTINQEITKLSGKIKEAGLETINDLYKVIKNPSGSVLNKQTKKMITFTDEERALIAWKLFKTFREAKMDRRALGVLNYYIKAGEETARTLSFRRVIGKAMELELGQKSIDLQTLAFIDKVSDYAQKYGVKITEELSQELESITRNVFRVETEKEKMVALENGLRNFFEKHFPKMPSPERVDILRYGWTLSNPMSIARNVIGNAFQSFVSRPLTKLTERALKYFSDNGYDLLKSDLMSIRNLNISEHLKNQYQRLHLAWDEFVFAFKNVNPSAKFLDLMSDKDNAERFLSNIHFSSKANFFDQASTLSLRILEATDRFFSTWIYIGEKQRLINEAKKAGVKITEDVLNLLDEQAIQTAETWLYRNRLGEKEIRNRLPYLAQALDWAGDSLMKIKNALREEAQKNKFVWPLYYAFSTFNLFIRTPMNIGKTMIEYSPLSADIAIRRILGDKSITTEQFAKLILGSLLTIGGAYKMLNNEITFMPPSDSELRKRWSDAVYKPFSIKIGDRWYSAWWLGPFVLPIMMPAAFKWASEELQLKEENPSIDEIVFRGMSAVLRTISEQTSLMGMSNMIKTLSGDIDYTFPQTLIFETSQYVPFNGLLRFFNRFLDDVYRKAGKTLPEGFKRDFSGYFKTWYQMLGKSEEEIEKLLPEPYTRTELTTGEVEPAKRSLAEKLLPYPAFVRTEPIKEEEFKQQLEASISKRQSRALIDEEIKQASEKEKEEAKALYLFLKNPDIDRETKIKKIEETDEKIAERVLRMFERDRLREILPEDIPPEIKNWSVRERANFIINYAKKHFKGQPEKASDFYDLLIDEGIITDAVEEEISRQLMELKQ
ncbi:MAG: hypothetical protein KatS3mg096_737 [Candidatus Parcubacteria bacterium]|nr:MAG: hypothetical protein KatS3mg096_737 [Candidatus Parcubacteria bacterium]